MKLADRKSILLQMSERPVGHGACCEIYRSRLSNGKLVAVKKVRRSPYDENDQARQRIIHIWVKLSHPNIVPLIGEIIVQENTAIVYEWIEYKSIYEYLKHHSDADRYQLSVKICDGLAYLHAHDIIYGNSRGNQILVSADGIPRIILSCVSTRTIHEVVRVCELWMDEMIESSLRWTAPEVIKSEDRTAFQSDVYSLGMTILEIITSSIPYPKQSDISVLGSIMEGRHPSRPMDTIPDNVQGNTLWRLLSACWSHNPEERPSAMEVGKFMDLLDFRVHQDSKSTVKFTDDIKVEDIAAFFTHNGIVDYTAELQRRNLQSPCLTKASAILYQIDLSIKRDDQYTAHTQRVVVKCVMDPSPYKQLKRATRELYFWSRYKHVNILPLLGFAILNGKLAMISPWIENGSITEYVENKQNADYYGLCTQLSRAINYLHTNGVIHGDIKGDNVLVSNEGIVKVMDFGVSIMAQLRLEFTHTGVGRGTERWQAPEILRRKTDSTKEGDIYALGMTIIEIYTHDRPYGNTDIGHDERCEIIAGTRRPGRPWRLPFDGRGTAFWALLQRCWSGDPASRPTSDEIYKQLVRE